MSQGGLFCRFISAYLYLSVLNSFVVLIMHIVELLIDIRFRTVYVLLHIGMLA